MSAHPPSIERGGVILRVLVACGLAIAVAFAAWSGYFNAAENSLRLANFELADQPASGQVQIVEMDAASVDAIREWPWSREHYAKVIEQLDAAGVRSIGFDVDFSSRSNLEADARFASAIEQVGVPVILPTFAQASSFGEGRKLDSLPIEPIRDHAKLASVSIAPDADGFIRRMPLGTLTGGVPRPSMAAFFAERAGSVDASFPIDYSIAVDTIPRHSFIDIERGSFDASALAGRDVIIGATAVEMGDRYAVPRYGVIPGVVVQALATETLYRGQPQYGSWVLPLIVAAFAAVAIMAATKLKRALMWAVSSALMLVIAGFYAQTTLLIWFDVLPALALVALSGGLQGLAIVKQQISHNWRTDRETGLPNAVALQEQIEAGDAALVFAAFIDEFDTIKAVLGREDFALFLRRISERLESALGGSAIFRVDDRALAWQSTLDLHEVEECLAGLRALMRSPIEVGGRRVDVSLNFGVATTDNDRAITNATHTASEAYRAGDLWRLHEAEQGDHLERQISLMGELDEAVRNADIKVFYQPKLDLKTNQITCAEALVRWQHRTRGMLPPNSFIPLAEESGRIEDLTLFVIRKTIEDLQQWCADGLVLGAAVNISAKLLASKSFVSRAEQIVQSEGVPLNRLTFEVTESAELDDPGASILALKRFKARGIAISMDDYGTGQSTLSYLKQLPLSELKIDRSFVRHAHVDRGDAMLVRSTVQLAHELGLKVVAEGIEEIECLDFLRSIDCDYAQGYYIGRPMGAVSLAEMAENSCKIAA